ncbi:MAG TPA: hypothetical protein VGM01_13770 [Ktedonobacteraceae bacterium]|jgi:hypothetical protein
MTTLVRTMMYLVLLVLLGVGIRLMYYGLETVVGASPHYDWPQVLVLLVGIVLFLGGLVTGILFLGPNAPARS